MSQEKQFPASPPLAKLPTRQNTQDRSGEPNLSTKLASNYGFNEADQPSQPPRRVSSQRSLQRGQSLTSLRSSQYTRTVSGTIPPLPEPNESHPATSTQARSQTDGLDQDVERGPQSEQDPAYDEEPAWGPSHPCFPHLNPHVPSHSPAYVATRIIRIRRDWMIVGDLAPTYSNIYPEILYPQLPEQEFRYMIQHINEALIHAYDPFSTSNWIDGILGFLTGWFWEDFRPGGVKGELKKLESWIEDWNRTVGASDGVKIIPLRRTGYTSLDIQIPDPQVRVIEGDGESNAASRPPGAGRTTR